MGFGHELKSLASKYKIKGCANAQPFLFTLDFNRISDALILLYNVYII